jgi:transposase
MKIVKGTGRARRGRYVGVPELKQAIVAACLEPGASVAGVALAHGVNANLVRKWIAKSQAAGKPRTDTSWLSVLPEATSIPAESTPLGEIEIELESPRVSRRPFGFSQANTA